MMKNPDMTALCKALAEAALQYYKVPGNLEAYTRAEEDKKNEDRSGC